MAHGKPDWGESKPTATIYPLSDLGELAARMGSINTFDRRGDVVWMDDFEDNIDKWQPSETGTGATVALSADEARSGGKCCKLTTGNEINNFTGILYHLGPSAIASRMGLEFSFILNHNARLYMRISAQQDVWTHACYFRYNPTDELLEYSNAAAVWTELVPNLKLKEGNCWHTIKMVADFTGSGEYVRLMLDNLTPSVSGLSMRGYAGAGADYLLVWIQCQALTAENHDMYIDDVIITQNEP